MKSSTSISEIVKHIELRDDQFPSELTKQLYGKLTVPSYVHGYSLAIQFMYDWFEKKFEKGYLKGGIYVDGKHVLDEYKQLNKSFVKGENPRARMAPTVEFDYDRETQDMYVGPPELYLRRSKYQDSFFKDYDRDIFLGVNMRALRMNFNFKVRVNSRAQQLDLYNKLELDCRIGSTQYQMISVDFHIPKAIMIDIAKRAGFKVVDDNVVDIIEFIQYINSHSDLPFLFKIRAINQKPEFFIRVNNLYTHISCKDKLQLDDGENDGKLNFNYHVELNAQLTMPIPHYYAYYSATESTSAIEVKESKDTVAIYSINIVDIPKVDENGWAQAAVTAFVTDQGDTEMDLSSLFTGDNILAKSINHDLVNGVSPSHFINVKVYKDNDVAKLCPIKMDWVNKKAIFLDGAQKEESLSIVIYYDRVYINELDISMNDYKKNRLSDTN